MKMKIVYVIGPLRADCIDDFNDNMNAARQAALELWKAGFAVICPHLNSGELGENNKDVNRCSEEILMKGSLKLLSLCDFAVVLDGWKDSCGSMIEIGYCVQNNKPIYYITEFLSIEDITNNEM